MTIVVSANGVDRWQQGAYDVWHLRDGCQIQQGNVTAQSREAVLWVDRAKQYSGQQHKVIAYLEGDVMLNRSQPGMQHSVTGQAGETQRSKTWLLRFQSNTGIEMRVPLVGSAPRTKPAIYNRGLNARKQESLDEVPPATQRFTVTPRSNVGLNLRTVPNPRTNEKIMVIDSGVRATIQGAEDFGPITIESDRLVGWTTGSKPQDFSREAIQSGQTPLELYLEGNIVFLQGDRVIYAQRMYYNIQFHYGVILDAELLASAPEYEGILRLKADVIQQVNQHNFVGHGAAITSSRLGVPSYWFQARQIELQDIQSPRVDPFTGQNIFDPETDKPEVDHEFLATSRSNFLYFGGIPVFYWPVMATKLDQPSYYISRLSYKNDYIFGNQLLTDWNAFQLFGIRQRPVGTKWNLGLDLLSERGIAPGTNLQYQRENFLGLNGANRGLFDAWGIYEQGLDNLGTDRGALVPEEDLRGRVFWQHRHYLDNGFQLTAEVGLISDRNFLEQYYELEWDRQKDQTTGVELKQLSGSTSWSILADVRTNDFFTQTEWLPRLDHYALGVPLLFNRLTWHSHSHAGYARLRTASTPLDAIDAAKFDPLAWEVADRSGLRAGTRHELDLPLELGVVDLTPYLLGDITHWQQDLTGSDVTRAYGQVGVRASMPMWKSDPTVQNTLLNLNGLAHKMVWEGELMWADSNRDLGRFPLYDPLDDDSQEHFRRRFFFDTFSGTAGGNVPLSFDERFYALRSGMQSQVTAPSAEIADDLTALRLGLRQRWQTKRGAPGEERIIDWIVLDIEGAMFPKPGRDNFGENIGMIDYDFRWHIGDRLSLLSDGYADFFFDGLRTVSVGGLMSRPELGSAYLGIRSIEGPISSTIISGSVSYRMSEKWIATGGTAFDFGTTGNIGQSISFTRVGEAMLVRVGVNIDANRGNFGVVFSIEPRFLPKTRLGQVGGVQIPPAGALGLE